jgi:DNA-binding Lrp family transcriptional regulator
MLSEETRDKIISIERKTYEIANKLGMTDSQVKNRLSTLEEKVIKGEAVNDSDILSTLNLIDDANATRHNKNVSELVSIIRELLELFKATRKHLKEEVPQKKTTKIFKDGKFNRDILDTKVAKLIIVLSFISFITLSFYTGIHLVNPEKADVFIDKILELDLISVAKIIQGLY